MTPKLRGRPERRRGIGHGVLRVRTRFPGCSEALRQGYAFETRTADADGVIDALAGGGGEAVEGHGNGATEFWGGHKGSLCEDDGGMVPRRKKSPEKI